MEIVKQSWRKDVFGTMATINITVKNTAPFDIKDIIIRCHFYAKSGTKVNSSKHTIYEIIEPGSTKKFRNVNLGFINPQASRGGCQVIYAQQI